MSDNKPDPLVDEFVIPAIKHLHRLVFWALEPALKPVSFVKVKSVEHLSGVICEIMMKWWTNRLAEQTPRHMLYTAILNISQSKGAQND